jgi:hypothetical protein
MESDKPLAREEGQPMGRMKWRDLKARLPPESQREIERGAEVMSTAAKLEWLRRARKILGDDWLDALDKARGKGKAATGDCDPRISSLREVVEAVGGELRIIARFPDVAYRINSFERASSEEESVEIATAEEPDRAT